LDGAIYVADPDLHRVRRIDALPQRTLCSVPKQPTSRRTPSRHRRTGQRHRRTGQPQRGSRHRHRRTTKRHRRTRHRHTTKPQKTCRVLSRAPKAIASGSPGQITTVAGTGTTCTTDPTCGDGGPATAASLAGPYGVWVDPSGRLFIADGRRGIREVQADGTIATVADGGGTYDIRSVTEATSGNLYATTPSYVLKVDPGGKVTPVVGTGTSGYNGNTDPNLGTLLPGNQVQVNHPAGASVALNGNVLFTDTDNDLLRAYVPSSDHVIDDLAGVVSNGSPQGGFNGDDKFADQTELDHPLAATVTRGALFVVADTHNRRVRQFGPSPLAQRRRSRPPRRTRPPKRAAPVRPKSARR
jgi:hypothetical protein